MDIKKFISFYEDDNEQQFKDFLSEYKGKMLHLVDNYLDVLKQSEADKYEETKLCLYYNETGIEAIPLWFIEEAWNYMKQKTVIDEVKETVISGVEESKYENLILKMLNNPKVVKDVNQLRQSAHLNDAIVVKILEMCLK